MPVPHSQDEPNSEGASEMESAHSHGDALRIAVEEEMELLTDGYPQEQTHETVAKFNTRVQDRARNIIQDKSNTRGAYPSLQSPSPVEYVIATPVPSSVANIVMGERVTDSGTSYATPFVGGSSGAGLVMQAPRQTGWRATNYYCSVRWVGAACNCCREVE